MVVNEDLECWGQIWEFLGWVGDLKAQKVYRECELGESGWPVKKKEGVSLVFEYFRRPLVFAVVEVAKEYLHQYHEESVWRIQRGKGVVSNFLEINTHDYDILRCFVGI